jgi:two-component system, NarL family, sensor kinase
VDLVRQNQSDPEKQLRLNVGIAKSAYDTAAVSEQMRRNEDDLLAQRSHSSRVLFDTILGILAVSFLSSGLMFRLHYSLLNRELLERRGAENQLRQLSLQLIRAQDEERRRFARELHDGLGQTLVGAKMLVDTILIGSTNDPEAQELATLLNDAISQTRTISYLFHPPLLDEAGFSSAARWLVEGYAQRMGLEVSADFVSPAERLPRSVETTMYRVLQEALNNIYRHSRSAKAEVSLRMDGKWATLRVRDYGRGIPAEKLKAFRANLTQVGVGLTGMRERVKEQGGEFEIRSDETGTELLARIPVRADLELPHSTTTEPLLNVG